MSAGYDGGDPTTNPGEDPSVPLWKQLGYQSEADYGASQAAGGAAGAASAAGDAASSAHAAMPVWQQQGFGSQAEYDQNQATAQGMAGAGPAAAAAGDYAAKTNPGAIASQIPQGGLLSDPGAYETWAQSHIGGFDTPSNVEQVYGNGALTSELSTSQTGQLGQVGPGAYQDWAGGAAAGLNGNSAQQDIYGSATNTLQGNNAASGFYGSNPYGNISSGAAANVNGASTAFNSAKGALSSPGAVQDVYGQYGDSFNAPGAYENFYGSTSNGGNNDPLAQSDTEKLYDEGIGQLDPYYDYAQRRAIEGAQTASAARGSFNSGLAAQQESDITGNIRGQQAQEQASLAPQADAARMSRLGLASSEANTANTDYNTRINDIFGLASTDENAQEGRFKTLSDIGSASDQSALGLGNLQVNAANGQASAAAAADASTRANVAGEESAAAGSDSSQLARVNAQAGILGQSEQLAQSADAQNTQRAQDADTEQRNRIQDIYGDAAAADTGEQNRLGAAAGLAAGEQNAAENRIGGAVSNTNKLDSQEAGLVQNILGNENQQVADLDETQLQALADYYGVDLQKIKDLAQGAGKVADIAIKLGGEAGSAAAGKPPGA